MVGGTGVDNMSSQFSVVSRPSLPVGLVADKEMVRNALLTWLLLVDSNGYFGPRSITNICEDKFANQTCAAGQNVEPHQSDFVCRG